jgi:hypothetical protein
MFIIRLFRNLWLALALAMTCAALPAAGAGRSDFDGDGRGDLLWRNAATGQVYLMPLNGAGVLPGTVVWTEPNPAWQIVGSGDFDGDGKADLLWYNTATGQVFQMLMNGGSVKSSAMVYCEPNTAWSIQAIADFDGDGRADLLWRNATTGQVYVMPMNGAAVLPGAGVWNEPNPAWQIVGTGDFDGDGKADILWWNANTGQVFQMLMDGLVVKASGMIYSEPNTAWTIQAVADFDGDHKADLLWRNASTGAVYVMPMDGSRVLPGAVVWNEPASAWQIVAAGDSDGDGKADIVWRNSTTGSVFRMLMEGPAVKAAATLFGEPNLAWSIVGGRASQESTLVLRVVATGPTWGQEPIPGWPTASPIKQAPGYSLYDLEIGRDAGNNPRYVALYRFPNNPSPFSPTLLQDALLQRTSSVSTAYVDTSQTLAALKGAVDLLLQRERPTRFVLFYSGHGAPGVFFEGSQTPADAKAFLKYLRDAMPGLPIVLDFSSNCSTGYFESALQWYESPNYLIASDKPVGGFDPDPDHTGAWIKINHDTIYDQFWKPENSLATALDSMVKARHDVWTGGAKSILASQVEQSIAVYDLSKFTSFMKALAADKLFKPDYVPQTMNWDIGTYVYGQGSPALVSAFETFRCRYSSDRDLFPWPATHDTRGFSFQNGVQLAAYLKSLP